MSFPNVLPSLIAPLVGVINPVSLSATSVSTGWIDMSKRNAVRFTLLVGAIATNGTLDAIVEESTTASDSGKQTITSKTITQLTDAGTDDNKQVDINVRADELDVADGYRYVKLTVTAAVAASLVAAVAYESEGRYANPDLTTVDEVKA